MDVLSRGIFANIAHFKPVPDVRFMTEIMKIR